MKEIDQRDTGKWENQLLMEPAGRRDRNPGKVSLRVFSRTVTDVLERSLLGSVG
jgi:hypothetical protein